MHPIEMFFSEHHPLSQFVKADFSGSEAGHTKAFLVAAGAFAEADGVTVHTGFSTYMLDTLMGGAVMGILQKVQPIATVGLAISHMRRPNGGEPIHGSASCKGVYQDLAYVTGEFRSEADEVLAIASGTFMIGTRATSIRNKTEDSRI